MRKSALFAGLLLSVLIFTSNSPQANAQSTLNTEQNSSEANAPQENQSQEATPAPAPEPPQVYKVVKGDSLSKIAKAHETTWNRLFNKNTQIADPNIINVNDEIVIPKADEVLAERPLPQVVPAPQAATSTPKNKNAAAPKPKAVAKRQSAAVQQGSSAGNKYVRGYCTWYAKNKRSDLPNNLGNANTWVSRARAQGIPTGSAPRVGAIGQQGMHVVYVESVNGDGTVTISEMNFKGLGVVSSRTVSASNFQYIY